ncbi:unnamed protein product [Fusarium graminearum]|nr:unnamed protein product [Fusarium graminearum]
MALLVRRKAELAHSYHDPSSTLLNKRYEIHWVGEREDAKSFLHAEAIRVMNQPDSSPTRTTDNTS